MTSYDPLTWLCTDALITQGDGSIEKGIETVTEDEIAEVVTLLSTLAAIGARAYGTGHAQDGASYSDAFMTLVSILNRAGYKVVVQSRGIVAVKKGA